MPIPLLRPNLPPDGGGGIFVAFVIKRIGVCGLLVLAVFISEAIAADSAPRLQLRLIRASNDLPELSDPKVRSLNAQLKADFGYNCYKQVFFSDMAFTRDEKARYDLPDDFGITITYMGRRQRKREFFVETEYRGKKFVGFYAVFPENANPVLIRGPGTHDYRYIIALTSG